MKSIILAIVACIALAGCNSVPFLSNAKDQIVSGVKRYCQEPQASRQTLRAAVNDSLGGSATVCVQCAGDAPDATCAPPPTVKPAAPTKSDNGNGTAKQYGFVVQNPKRHICSLDAILDEMAQGYSGRIALDRRTDSAYRGNVANAT